MYRSTTEQNAPESEAQARQSDTRARRKAGQVLTFAMIALTATMAARGYALRLATPGALRGNIVAAVVVAPILMAIFWKIVGGKFRRCQEAARSTDVRVI